MWLNNVRIVLADRVLERGALRLEGGVITEIAETPVAGAGVDGQGLLLMPGFIDMHGDMIEREVEPRPRVKMPFELGFRDLDRRLKVAGITTAYASLGFSGKSSSGHLRSHDHSMGILRALKKMRPALSIDHKVHARFEITFPAALEAVKELIEEGTVDLLSLMDHTPGQGQYRDIERLIRAKEAETQSREEAERAVAESFREKVGQAGDTFATIKAMAEACASAGIPIASHDDDTPEKVLMMHSIGAGISEFPVTLEAAREAHARGMAIVMGAPNALRGESYSGNLSARSAHRSGVLDILAADYHPSAILPAILILAADDPLGLAGAARLATGNPARALGLPDRGEIAVGKRADLIIADDQGVGHVRATFARGELVYSDGTLAVPTPVVASGEVRELAMSNMAG
ncbi:alpha-D-ribose 1-methylphosphonate 5-triphosphate diphosphatase [Mesorhizobium retamae]|uniref:Alpha-D-ribose 1-methylphosphonate 5-triphosphate diphosphatase n=1 Tax=Mesorhizobium retamae TaxID=2912854 RepID=A0ABS9QDB1_9HYPH|nr:alpha-D-ribose 1-methylphosphonate 5-triphosphate diphosphatase [Mesorhizobium sp. IRAMC:0171]MCG7505411.1 alpha-D-ribose 1-methylphosphonate 5-triphosphate diphosphatase [Mesorhizobium sp. IRAMC:0171]